VELETIMGREIEDLRDALCEAWDDDSRFDLLESWLVRRARSRTQPTRSVSYALRVIHGGLDAVRIGRIADTMGISHKHLLREFDRCGFESCFISERQVRDSRDYFREIHHPSEIRPYEISWALLPRQRRVRLLDRRHQQH
jgi:AraC-like DNA-binding protein